MLCETRKGKSVEVGLSPIAQSSSQLFCGVYKQQHARLDDQREVENCTSIQISKNLYYS